jgi:hypothetical protein
MSVLVIGGYAQGKRGYNSQLQRVSFKNLLVGKVENNSLGKLCLGFVEHFVCDGENAPFPSKSLSILSYFTAHEEGDAA